MTIAPGAYLVVPRRTAAFNLRHNGVPLTAEYFQPSANLLDNGSETIALVAANGATIESVQYGDDLPWPAAPDGTGPSLVRIAPLLNTNPNAGMNWRTSAGLPGNPGTSDALPVPANPEGDDNGNGIANLVEYALGGGAAPVAGRVTVGANTFFTLTIERAPRADAAWEIESTANFNTWLPAGAALTTTARITLPSGNERITLRAASPLSAAPQQFYRAELRTQPEEEFPAARIIRPNAKKPARRRVGAEQPGTPPPAAWLSSRTAPPR